MLGMISGTEVAASSMMPLRGSAAVRFRWGLKLPAELQTAFSDRDRTAGIPFARIPLLVMSKISIEHVATDTKVKKTKAEEPDDVAKGSGDVAQTCSLIRRQLEALRAENGAMSNALEEIRKEVGVADVAKREMCVADVAKRETRGAPPMPSPEELTQELAKALKK